MKTKKLTVIAPIERTHQRQWSSLLKTLSRQIDGKKHTEGMDVNQAVSLIRGQPGTNASLRFTNGKQKDWQRAWIELHPVRYS